MREVIYYEGQRLMACPAPFQRNVWETSSPICGGCVAGQRTAQCRAINATAMDQGKPRCTQHGGVWKPIIRVNNK